MKMKINELLNHTVNILVYIYIEIIDCKRTIDVILKSMFVTEILKIKEKPI